MKQRIVLLKNTVRLGALLAVVAGVSACSDGGQSILTSAAEGGQAWELSPPEFLSSRTVVLENLAPRVTINGEILNLTTLNDGIVFRGETQVAEGDDVALKVEWFEFFSGRQLLLAVAESTYPSINRNTVVTLFEADYTDDDLVTYPRLDDDNDRVPNLIERNENSNPLSAADPGDFRADAFVADIDPSRAPIIDGRFDLIWGDAQFRDRERDLLFIDNRLVGFDSARAEGDAEFRFGALHDGSFLYLYILGEDSDKRTTFGDSIESWNDDSVDIYWDGNRSQGSAYDGVDDYHVIIPLTKLNQGVANRSHFPDGTPDPDGRAETGFNSAEIPDLDGVRFATCICPGSDIYEIRLDLEKLQIPLDRSFGFEIQINNDVDGGDRDFKFGWRAPSAPNGVADADFTWENPSTMGLLELITDS